MKIAWMALSIFAYAIAGYLLGLIIGFTVFDPNADVYALLGVVLAVVGLSLGLIPAFRRAAGGVFGAVVGFYIGAVISTLLSGNPQTDDLLEVLQRGVVLPIAIAAIGVVIGARVIKPHLSLPALGFLLGGFLEGFVFLAIGVASSTSIVMLSPFVIGSGVVIGVALWMLQRRSPQPQVDAR